MKSCIYAGSFDCFHNGHANIVKRALKAFDQVRILVANNPKKKYLFNINERLNIIHHYFNDTRIVVDILSDTSLVSDYAREKGVQSILKGIRNIQDTEYEKMLHEITVSQENGIDTFVLFSDPKDQKISSSSVKELIKFNADVRDYVPLYTKQMLEIAQNGQYIMGVTGGIGSGKSFITNLMSHNIFQINGLSTINVDLDVISNNITYSTAYDSNQEVIYLRSKVFELLGLHYPLYGTHVHDSLLKEKLKNRVFSDAEFNAQLGILYRPVMIREIRKQIAGKSGLIILNGALLVDADMHYLCNNNVVVVSSSDFEVNERLMHRYNDQAEVNRRINAQLSSIEKLGVLNQSIKSDGHGTSVLLENCKGDSIVDLIDPDDKSKSLYEYLSYAGFWSALKLI